MADSPSPTTLKRVEEARREIKVPIHLIHNSERNDFDLIDVMAGNGKDDPREIPRLTTPILKEGIDYVQGSRFLPGGRRQKNPFLRSIFIRLFPVVWTSMTGVHCTEVTNGFRAYKCSILNDPRINVWQTWLDNYELEYYLHYKALTLGYKFAERPVSKDYTEIRKGKYSHISPLKDWWQIVGPVFMLKLGVKK